MKCSVRQYFSISVEQDGGTQVSMIPTGYSIVVALYLAKSKNI